MSNDFYETVQEIDIPAYDQGNDSPPRMYWHNGIERAGTGGSFYIKADELGGEEPGAPWQPAERFRGEPGYATEKLKVAIIGYKQQAFRVEGAGKDARKIWLPEWVEGARIQTEILCFAQGIEQAPIVWVTKGNTGKAITAKGGILSEYRAQVLTEASKKAGKPLPLWSFWLPIQTLKKNGEIQYPDTGHGSSYTPPMLHPSILNLDAAIENYWIGETLYIHGAAIRDEMDSWLKQKRGGVEAAAQADDEVGFDRPPVDRGANVPQRRPAVLDDSDLPF